MFFDWIHHSIEWTEWSEPVMRVSTIGTIFFTLLAMWSVVSQIKTIRLNKSGESVSVPMFAYIGNLYFAFGYYGWTRMSIAMVFNGMIGFLYLGVLWNLKNYKGFSQKEVRLMQGLPALIVLMILVPFGMKEHLMTAILFGSIFLMGNQPYEIWKNKKAGSLDIRFIGVFLTSTLFWTIFAFRTHTVPLMVVNPFVFIVMGSTVVLWMKYKKSSTVVA